MLQFKEECASLRLLQRTVGCPDAIIKKFFFAARQIQNCVFKQTGRETVMLSTSMKNRL
jgi:hypothetical protein